MVLICIFQKISDVEHLFMYLLASCISWKNVCSVFLPIFSLDCFLCSVCLLLLSCMSYFYVLDINPLSDICSSNVFSHSVCYFFILLISPCRSFLVWCSSACWQPKQTWERTAKTEEPGGLQSMRLQRIRHDWVTKHVHCFNYEICSIVWSQEV